MDSMLTNNISKSGLIKVLMYCYAFLVIFTPPALYPLANLHLLAIVALYFLLTKYSNEFSAIIRFPELKIFTSLHVVIIIYSIIQDTFTSFTSQYYSKYGTAIVSFITIAEILPCAIFISIYFLRQKTKITDVANVILAVGVLQMLCVILTLLLPDFRNWTIASFTSQDVSGAYEMMNKYRMFGLAKGYTFSMPLFLGLCVIIAYILGTYTSSKYFYLIPFYLASIAINARTALISLLIAPAVIFALQIRKNILKEACKLLFICLIIGCVVLIIKYNADNSSTFNAWVWLNSGIEEIVSLKGGEATGNLESLTDVMWFMPKGTDILFGTGEFVFGRGYQSSDIGYVINLNYGGIFMSLVLYSSYLIFIWQSIGKSPIENALKYTICIYLLFTNLKGNVFTPHDLTIGVIIIAVYYLIYNKAINKLDVSAPAVNI